MKKVKVIFPDGSIGEVNESDLQSALASGARRYTNGQKVSKVQMQFADGSMTDVDSSDIETAISAGAKVFKKKDVGVSSSADAGIGGLETSQSEFQLPSPLLEEDFRTGYLPPTGETILQDVEDIRINNLPDETPSDFIKNDILTPSASRGFNDFTEKVKEDVFSNPESLSKYNKNRIDQLNTKIQKLRKKQNEYVSMESAGVGAKPVEQINDKKAYSDLQNQINNTQKYIDKLKSSVANVATGMVVSQTDLSTVNPTEIGRDIIKISEPELEQQYKMAEDGGHTLPGIQRSEMERLGLASIKKYIIENPDAPNSEQSLKMIQSYEKDFDERNFELTGARVREKLAAYFYRNGKSGQWNYSEKTLEDAVNDPDSGLTEAEIKVAKSYVIPLEKKIIGTQIPGSGFARSFTNAIERSTESAGRSLLGLVGQRNEGDAALDVLNQEIDQQKFAQVGESARAKSELYYLKNLAKTGTLTTDEENKITELEKYTNVRNLWSEFKDGVGDLTGQVVQIALLTKGIGSVGKALSSSGGVIGGLTTGTIGKVISNETVGLFLSSALNSYDSYLQQSISLFPGKDKAAERQAYSTFMMLVEGGTEGIFRDTKVLKAFTKGLSPTVTDITRRLVNREITQEVARNEFKSAAKQYLKPFGKEFLKAEFQESFEEGSVDIFDGIAQSVFGGQPFDVAKTGRQALNTFATTAMYSPLISGLAAHGAYRQNVSQNAFLKSSLVDMGAKQSEYLKAVEQLQIDGTITPQEANDKIKIIKQAGIYLRELPEEKQFDFPQVSSYLLHRMNEGIATEKLSKTTDKIEKSKLENDIKRSEEIRKGIYDNTIGVTPRLQEVAADQKEANKLNILSQDQVTSDDLIGTPFEKKNEPEALNQAEQSVIDKILADKELPAKPNTSLGWQIYHAAQDPRNHRQIIETLVDQSNDQSGLLDAVGIDVVDAVNKLGQESKFTAPAEMVVEDKLKDVESTAKALVGLRESAKGEEYNFLFKIIPSKFYDVNKDDSQSISEAYHDAKGKPETGKSAIDKMIISRVEEAIGKPAEGVAQPELTTSQVVKGQEEVAPSLEEINGVTRNDYENAKDKVELNSITDVQKRFGLNYSQASEVFNEFSKPRSNEVAPSIEETASEIQHTYGNYLPQLKNTVSDFKDFSTMDETSIVETKERLQRIADKLEDDKSGIVDVASIKSSVSNVLSNTNAENIKNAENILINEITKISDKKILEQSISELTSQTEKQQPITQSKNQQNEKVIEQTTENQTTAIQPGESTGTETTESETTQGTEETVKNEEKRVSLANEPIAKAAGVSQTEATPKEAQYNGQDVIGSRSRPESEKVASRKSAKEKIKSPDTNVSLRTANEYNKSVGLPEVTSHTFKPSEKVLQTEISELYPKLQDVTSASYTETDLEREIFESYKAKFPEVISENNITNYKELVEKSYAKLAEEADAQLKALKIKVDFHNGDQNYDSSAEMLDDVHNFGHLWVFQGGEDHTLLGSKTADENGLTANDKFRAVHDYFGHSIEGFEFGKNGEENAWIEHSKMFSPLAQWALSSETRGQNSYVNYSGVNEVPLEKMKLGTALKKKGTAEGNQEMAKDGQKLLDESNNEFSYSEQKSVILPEKYSDASKYFKPSKQSISESGKVLADRLRSLRPKKGDLQATFFGLPLAIYDTAIVSIANAVEAGANIAQVVNDVVNDIKSQINDWKFEKQFRQAIDDTIAGKKPKAITSGDVSPTEEPVVSGIKKALVSEDIIEGVDLDKIGDKEMMALGRKIINSGEVKPQILVNQIVSNKKGVLTPKEVVALITYKADIDRELREAYEEKNRLIQRGNNLSYVDAEISDLEDRITAFDIMAVITANQQSMAFRLRKMMLDRDYNIVTQIEKYKSKNNGYIPPEIEAKFREMAKELDEVKQKLADAEKREEDRAGNEAILDIQEDVQRNPTEGLTKEEIDLIVQAGIEQEINAIREKLPTERKKRADKKIAALEAIQKKLRGKAYDAGLGIPVAIIDAGITVIKNAIKLDVAIRDAVELGINKIKQLYGQTWDKEDDFRKDMLDGFKDEGVDIKKEKEEKPLVDEKGNIVIPNSLIRDLVKRGFADINDLTDEVYDKVKPSLPDVTKRQVRDAITSYGKQVNPTKDEISKQINTAKRIGRLLSELEDLQTGVSGKVKKAVFRKSAITKQEQELKRKIKVLSDALKITQPALTEESNLNNRKAAARRRISELENRIAKKDYGKRPKPPLHKEDTELVHLRTKKEHLQQRFDEEQYRIELKNRTGWQKTGDVLLELVSGLPRALVASIDFSAMLIQGLFRLARHPIHSMAAAKQMFTHFASEKTQKEWEAAIKAQDWFPMLEASGIDLTEVGGKLNAREELFISDWINHIWDGIGWVASLGNKKVHNVWKKINPYKASNRAYVGYLNSIRVSAFLEGANYLQKKGLSFESNPEDFKAWGNYVNTITGRGSLGVMERASKLFSIAFFSPRKIAASLKLFTPYVFVYYAKMPKAVRRKAILDFASSIGILTGATVLASAAISGGDDDDEFWNPTSSDFLTIRSGNTRVDILGGMKQYLVFMSRMFTGRFTNANGIKDVLGERTGKTINTRFDLGVQFVTNKLSPLISLGARKLQERKGAELDQQEELINHVIPIWMQDVKQLYQEQPALIATMLNILTIFGAGIRSYESMPRPTSYSPEDLKDPLFKYFTDKEVSIPEPNASSVEIKDEQAGVIRKLKDLGEDKIKEYSEVHKKYLKENIQEIIDIGYVYKDIYDRVSTTDDDNEKETIEIDKLTKPQLKSIISILSGKATKQTKEDLFGEEE